VRLLKIYKDSFTGLSKEVWILSLAMLINRTGAMVLPFMSLYLSKELQFSLPETGFVMAFYGVGSILGSFVGGWLTDKYGYSSVQLFSLSGAAVLLIPLLFVTDYYGIIACIFGFSFLSDMFRPANAVAIVTLSKPENRTRSLSLNRLAMNLGFSLGPTLGGLIAAYADFKWIFLFDSITCLIAAAIVWAYLPNNSIIKNRSGLIDTPLTEEQTPTKHVNAYQDAKYITFLLLVALFGLAFFQLFSTFPVYLNELHYDEKTIGLILGLNGLLVFILEMPIIAALEKYKRPMVLVAIGGLFMSLSYFLVVWGHFGIGMIVLFVFVITLSEIFAMPFMLNYALNKPAPEKRGQYMAFYSIAFGLSHIFGPSLGMNVAEVYNFKTLFIVLGILSIFISWGYFSLRKRIL
jgi:predicted MFS family arabinose efflux permease